uniref:Protein GPR107-like n=1 Tax=Petromyzon marinus TaxID=7757 RepID=A0AAJ7U3H5_PETMA|nr:protein GPR107-like [Petromyzon marinus]
MAALTCQRRSSSSSSNNSNCDRRRPPSAPPLRLLAPLVLLGLALRTGEARKHHLSLREDTRSQVQLSTFGYEKGGTLSVRLTLLKLGNPKPAEKSVGFSLYKAKNDGLSSYLETDVERCMLREQTHDPVTLFTFDFARSSVVIKLPSNQTLGDALRVFGNESEYNRTRPSAAAVKVASHGKPGDGAAGAAADTAADGTKEGGDASGTEKDVSKEGDQTVAKVPSDPKGTSHVSKRDADKGGKDAAEDPGAGAAAAKEAPKDAPKDDKKEEEKKDSQPAVPGNPAVQLLPLRFNKTDGTYAMEFVVEMAGASAAGLYTFFFHNCDNGKRDARFAPFTMEIEMVEFNLDSYLSVGEIPLPRLYVGMAVIFFISGVVWVSVLRRHRANVFKIHWLMTTLVFTKALSLLFHAIDYHFISTQGRPIEGWAVVYYITHLLKGALLFITIVLVGTGWTFIKHILSDKDKKLFMVVIPLQVLANVAYIVLESSEQGSSDYGLWKELLFLVDLLCCGAILFPVIWSIRHLQESSNTDGKAAISLEKLKLFRHYYVLIICYIYFTRIIAIMVKITIPFQWQWLYQLMEEAATLVFFVVTGYRFRPASDNPYLRLPTDEDSDSDEVLTETGAGHNLTRVNKGHSETGEQQRGRRPMA